MQIVAAIEEYRHHLEHLDRIRISFSLFIIDLMQTLKLLKKTLIYNIKTIPVINTTMR